MKRKIEESYFYRIFTAMFVVCLVFVLIMSGITGVAFYGLYQTSLKEQSQGTAGKIRAALDNVAESYRDVLLDLAASDATSSFLEGNSDRVNGLIRELYVYRNSFVEKAAISVVRLSDRCWVSTSTQVMPPNSQAEFMDWGVFRKANSTDDVAVYAMARDALLSNEDRICMAKACRSGNGQIIGYVLAELPRSTIEDIVVQYSDQYNTSTVIANKTASVIYHSEGVSREGLGKAEKYGFVRKMARDIGVTEQNYAFSRSDLLDITVLQEVPSDVLSVVMKTIITAMIPGVLVIAVLAFMFSRILAKSLSDPIQEMIRSMGMIKKGDLSVRLNFRRKDEIGQLGREFDSMTERVEELMERIDEEKHSLWIAETRSLSLQMNPHFLYNTLDLIKWNAKLGKNEEIVDITVLLSRVLRRIMNTATDLVEVSYELEIVCSFVEIQRKHYGDRLSLDVDVEEDMRSLYIPKLVIQPIVENAIVHGFATQSEPCHIKITGRRRAVSGSPSLDELLMFCVEDNGIGMNEEELAHILEFRQEGTHHIGLNNVQRRAKLFGDENCGITVKSEPGKGTTVTLVLKAVRKP